jgi:hypothetical protein
MGMDVSHAVVQDKVVRLHPAMCRERIKGDAEDDMDVELSSAKKLCHGDGIQQAAHIDRDIQTCTSVQGGGIGKPVLE